MSLTQIDHLFSYGHSWFLLDGKETEKTCDVSDGPGSQKLLSVLFNLTVIPDIENLTCHIPCYAGLIRFGGFDS